MKHLLIFFCIITSSFSAELTQEIIINGLQKHKDKFPLYKIDLVNKAVDFELDVAKNQVVLDGEFTFAAFRIKVPQKLKAHDFVWYFNAPHNWAHWYIIPASGEFKPAFKNWIDAIKLYEKFDSEHKDVSRCFQELASSYFTPGKEYIIWFNKKEDGPKKLVKGRLKFSKGELDRGISEFEKELGVKQQPTRNQVKLLNSRGAKMLLDKNFFTPSYAESQIESVFFSLKTQQNFSNGMFIRMETHIPPCGTDPKFSDIRKIYGEPDFIVTSKEEVKFQEMAPKVKNITTHYYDYFGFEVSDKTGTVKRVRTQAENYSTLINKEIKNSFGQLPTKGIMTFYQDQKEVGRIYNFMRDHTAPSLVAEPPVGEYENGNQKITYSGKGNWTKRYYYENGSLAAIYKFENNLLNGQSKGFHEDSTIRFIVDYKDGTPHGKLITYNKEGKEVRNEIYENGKLKK